MNDENKKDSSKKKKVVTTIIVVALLAVIVVLGMIIYKLLHKEPEVEGRGAEENLVVGEENDKGSDAMFTTDMNMIWTFPSGKRTSTNAQIGNSKLNQYDVYFEVYLDDEEQTLLYSSKVIPVGKKLKKLKLDKALPDGQYSAVCTFHLLDDEKPNEEISRISFNVTLIFADGTAEQS